MRYRADGKGVIGVLRPHLPVLSSIERSAALNDEYAYGEWPEGRGSHGGSDHACAAPYANDSGRPVAESSKRSHKLAGSAGTAAAARARIRRSMRMRATEARRTSAVEARDPLLESTDTPRPHAEGHEGARWPFAVPPSSPGEADAQTGEFSDGPADRMSVRSLSPSGSVVANARDWWLYALACVKFDLRRSSGSRWVIQAQEQARATRRRYCELFKFRRGRPWRPPLCHLQSGSETAIGLRWSNVGDARPETVGTRSNEITIPHLQQALRHKQEFTRGELDRCVAVGLPPARVLGPPDGFRMATGSPHLSPTPDSATDRQVWRRRSASGRARRVPLLRGGGAQTLLLLLQAGGLQRCLAEGAA